MKNALNQFIILTGLLLAGHYISAQSFMGLQFGTNLALGKWTEFDDADVVQSLNPQFLIALNMEINVSEKFMLQPEIAYITKGAKYRGKGDESDASLAFKYNYFDFSLLGKYVLYDGFYQIGLEAGPTFGHMRAGKSIATYTFNGKKEKETYEIDFDEDNIHQSEVSLQVGVFLKKKTAWGGSIVLSARYQHGLNNIVKPPGGEKDEYRNRGIRVSMGFFTPVNPQAK